MFLNESNPISSTQLFPTVVLFISQTFEYSSAEYQFMYTGKRLHFVYISAKYTFLFWYPSIKSVFDLYNKIE